MPLIAYSIAYLPLALALVGFWLGGGWTWAAPAMVFGVFPLLELSSRGSEAGPPALTGARRLLGHGLLYLAVPAQLLGLGAFLQQVSMGALHGPALIGATLSAGILCALYGINAAHELGHRRHAVEQWLARFLLCTTLYGHFFVEHLRGHHTRVASVEDPASARRGETVYAFWLRSILGSWQSAWALEDRRLSRLRHPRLSPRNELLWITLFQVALAILVLAVFGAWALLAWCSASLIGILHLETANYIQHYGLSRERLEDGRYARVMPHHSWNSNRSLSRALLFDLGRHSDHHAHPLRAHLALRHAPEAPLLPAGYTGMVLLALFPPGFFRVMHRQLRASIASGALAGGPSAERRG